MRLAAALLISSSLIHVAAAQPSAAVACLEPPPMVGLDDYKGPFAKLVGTFGHKLEQKAAHPPDYKPGTKLCSLPVKGKFLLFIHDTFEPVSMLSSGFNAGINQMENQDPSFGQGSAGYARRLGADFASQTTSRFFKDFAYPTIFSQDPRYYRQFHGSGATRFVHAVAHTFVAYRDTGKHTFNFSQWLGTASSVALNNYYHPGNQGGFSPALRSAGYSMLSDMGSDILREFWPDIARKLKMPFRELSEPAPEPKSAN
jgi:hypothetical protein